MKKLALLTWVIIVLIQFGYCQAIPVDSLYFGQTPPGDTPVIFAPGIISVTGRKDKIITFSPDGKSVFYSVGEWPNCKTMFREYKNDRWTNPELAPFSKSRSVDEPIFSPDGKRLYHYAYDAPNSCGGADICYSVRIDSVWSEPFNVGNTLNTSGDEYHPSFVNDSSLYFENTDGVMYRSQYKNGTYQSRTVLPFPINPTSAWGDCYVSPDESYIIMGSSSRGGFGGTDLFISYRKENNSWTNPKNLGGSINTSASEYSGDITADGKYLTFWKNNDLYWASANFIDSLKHTNFIPYLKTKIPAQSDSVGHSFSYTIPDSAFIDDDGNNTLAYTATLSDGSPLPSWLPFEPATRTFSGNLTGAGSFSIKVVATDDAKATVSCTFTLNVAGNPVSLSQIDEQSIQLFPNPTTGQLTLNLGSSEAKNAVIEIINVAGESIFLNSYQNVRNTHIDLKNKPKGIYLLKLSIEGKQISRKICLE